jgi:hypothetical protein
MDCMRPPNSLERTVNGGGCGASARRLSHSRRRLRCVGRPLNLDVRGYRVRLWTLHPKYLDARGLVALWREGLLARAVLRGTTKGYRHHPQLQRFRAHTAPRVAINAYLRAVANEAEHRGYTFDRRKLGPGRVSPGLSATRGQLAYEWKHLLRKLRTRSPELHARFRRETSPDAHPLFSIVPGDVEPWERR